MIERRDVFQAIADPTRRSILLKLANGPLNIAQLAEDFAITRQAISKHVRILKECEMIKVVQSGREQLCEAQLGKLEEVSDWISASKQVWNQRFEKLDQFLQQQKNS